MASLVTTGIPEWIAWVEQVAQPQPDVIAELELALHQAFEFTQSQVHVITGSLRGSGRPESDYVDSVWIGSVTYGGDSPGFPNDPVEYATYEMARGGDHNFMGGLEQFEPLFFHAIGQQFT